MPIGPRVENVTTLQGLLQQKDGMSFDGIMNANDSIISIVSIDPISKSPSRIEYISNKTSTLYKAVEILTYDASGELLTKQRSIEDR